jgi:hypothetical protein
MHQARIPRSCKNREFFAPEFLAPNREFQNQAGPWGSRAGFLARLASRGHPPADRKAPSYATKDPDLLEGREPFIVAMIRPQKDSAQSRELPQEDQEEVAEVAREIEVRRTGVYVLSDEEKGRAR